MIIQQVDLKSTLDTVINYDSYDWSVYLSLLFQPMRAQIVFYPPITDEIIGMRNLVHTSDQTPRIKQNISSKKCSNSATLCIGQVIQSTIVKNSLILLHYNNLKS